MFDLPRHIASSKQFLLHFVQFLLHFALLLFGRHWIVGLTNVGLTALFGLGVVRAAERWRFLRMPPQAGLQLRCIVLAVALFKGAFYLVLGESLNGLPNSLWFAGIQLPGPVETAGLMAQTMFSIWHPTQISRWVILILSGMATLSLSYRLSQLLLAKRAFTLWMKIGAASQHKRASLLLEGAARSMGLPAGTRLPEIFEVDLPQGDALSQTPMLIGLGHPLLLLPLRLVTALSEAELEMVLRHELAHFIRRDHWWRWLLLWVTDVAGMTLLALPLKQSIIEIEELLCDRLAVQSSQEAALLAEALRAAGGAEMSHTLSAPVPLPGLESRLRFGSSSRSNSLPPTVASLTAVPLLLGSYATSWQPHGILRGRLEGLLLWSNELADAGIAKKTVQPERKRKILTWAIILAEIFRLIRGSVIACSRSLVSDPLREVLCGAQPELTSSTADFLYRWPPDFPLICLSCLSSWTGTNIFAIYFYNRFLRHIMSYNTLASIFNRLAGGVEKLYKNRFFEGNKENFA